LWAEENEFLKLRRSSKISNTANKTIFFEPRQVQLGTLRHLIIAPLSAYSRSSGRLLENALFIKPK
jgi:hypothetical protein